MTFIEAVVNVDSLKHTGKTKKPKIEELGELFDTKVLKELSLKPNTANSSPQTIKELKQMVGMIQKLTDEQKKRYLNTDEDTSYYIKEYMSNNDLAYTDEDIEKITDSARHIGRQFKNQYMRPRPFVLAEKLGMEMDYFNTDTSQSPSYPSNHALQARVVANYYSSIYPQHKSELLAMAEISALGRVHAGIHYPSDKIAGYQLADACMKYFKYDILEDAPLNATGTAVATDVPVVKKKKKYEPAQLFDLIKRNSQV